MTNTYAFVTNNEGAMTENFKPEIKKLNAHKCPVSGMSSPYRQDIRTVFDRII
jgi:hypothetical protein